MKTYTITKENFLNWYYCTGADDEQKDARTEMGRRVIDRLLNGEDFHFSVEDAFNEVEVSCIPLSYLEEFSDDDREVGDLDETVEINLI